MIKKTLPSDKQKAILFLAKNFDFLELFSPEMLFFEFEKMPFSGGDFVEMCELAHRLRSRLEDSLLDDIGVSNE